MIEAGKLLEVLQLQEQRKPQMQEIRIRVGQPIFLYKNGCEWYLNSEYQMRLVNGRKRPAESDINTGKTSTSRADQRLLKELLGIFSKHSLYAYEDELRQGFLTIEGGHRIGISGKVVLGEHGIRTIKDFSGINIRVAHEVHGCADMVLPNLYENGKMLNTLLVSPPGAGKTTLLRDLIRQVSDGNSYSPGLSVSVVDERSELGACVRGVPQCDLGMRTDVMDGCPKVLGMQMMIRSMAPQVVAVDEIGTQEDLDALWNVMKCGCVILATVHGDSVEDLLKKPVICEMVKGRMFERYVVLSAIPAPGTVVGIYGEDLRRAGNTRGFEG